MILDRGCSPQVTSASRRKRGRRRHALYPDPCRGPRPRRRFGRGAWGDPRADDVPGHPAPRPAGYCLHRPPAVGARPGTEPFRPPAPGRRRVASRAANADGTRLSVAGRVPDVSRLHLLVAALTWRIFPPIPVTCELRMKHSEDVARRPSLFSGLQVPYPTKSGRGIVRKMRPHHRDLFSDKGGSS
jgi:hypothetical protein